MRITSDDNESYLEIRCVDVTGNPYPSVCLSFVVEAQGFGGRNLSAWVAQDACNSFVAALRECETHRKGVATIEGMSPERMWQPLKA
jgi:hypothetical protein